jgi:hypothetical protein
MSLFVVSSSVLSFVSKVIVLLAIVLVIDVMRCGFFLISRECFRVNCALYLQ